MTDYQSTHAQSAQQVTEFSVEYRDIPGFPGYRVGNDGSIWSRWTVKNKKGKSSGFGRFLRDDWRLRNTCVNSEGYHTVRISNEHGTFTRSVHRLVLLSFIGESSHGMEACHNDGNRTNNRLVNLRWDTRTSNQHDRRAHGTWSRGRRKLGSK